jgi:hypothetical protein
MQPSVSMIAPTTDWRADVAPAKPAPAAQSAICCAAVMGDEHIHRRGLGKWLFVCPCHDNQSSWRTPGSRIVLQCVFKKNWILAFARMTMKVYFASWARHMKPQPMFG